MTSSLRIVALVALASAGAGLVLLPASRAQDEAPLATPPSFTPSVNDFGEPGLIQDPTARLGADGQIRITYSHVEPYIRYTLDATVLPWLEANLRYTDITNQLYSPFSSFSGSSETYLDRMVGVKLRLHQESESFPEVSLGIRDLGGTSLFGAEYLAFSRRYYDFDFTGGIGWGQLATRGTLPNPFRLFGKSFAIRANTGTPGSVAFTEFHGEDVGLFAGVEWHTPWHGIRVKLEYDPNDYQDEPFGEKFVVRAPINASVSYRPFSFLDLSAGVERGNVFMLRASVDTNLNGVHATIQDVAPPPVPSPAAPTPAVGLPLNSTPLPQVSREITDTGLPVPQPFIATPEIARPAVPRETIIAAAPAVAPRETIVPAAPFAPAETVAAPPAPSSSLVAAAPLREPVMEGEPGASPEGVPLDQSSLPLVGQASETNSTDRLYDGAQRLGYEIEDFSIDGDTATLLVAGTTPATTAPSVALAQLVFADVGGLSHAVINDREAGHRTISRHFISAAAAAAAPPPPMIAEARPDVQPVDSVESSVRATPVSAAPGSFAPGSFAGAAGPAAGAGAPPNEKVIAGQVFADLKTIGFKGQSFSLAGPHAYVVFSQDKYRDIATAVGRAGRIVARRVPPRVALITVDVQEEGLITSSVTFLRSDLQRAVAQDGSTEEIWANATVKGGDADRPAGIANPKAYPDFSWSLTPQTRQQLGGPQKFLFYQLYAELDGTVDVTPGLSFTGALAANIANNFADLQPNSNSTLPHVRSDIDQYLKQGGYGVDRLQGDYFVDIAPNLYGRVSGGLLEQMFGGLDGEVLYRPDNRPWAVGVDVSHVYQRGFTELFTFQPYHVTTAFLNFYYKLPFYDLLATVHAGRYLAGDKGATLDISRTFKSGIRIGVFATKTNVSAAQFGEGSFDKGFYISVPLDIFFGTPTRGSAGFLYRPLTRDGGQMLDIANPLYDVTSGTDPATVTHDWPQLLK